MIYLIDIAQGTEPTLYRRLRECEIIWSEAIQSDRHMQCSDPHMRNAHVPHALATHTLVHARMIGTNERAHPHTVTCATMPPGDRGDPTVIEL